MLKSLTPPPVNSQAARRFWSLHQGRSRKPLVSVVANHGSPLCRIDWPDIGLSAPANLSRCKDAAREWAEQQAMTERGKTNAARRLKSLNNLWWSSSYVAQKERPAA